MGVNDDRTGTLNETLNQGSVAAQRAGHATVLQSDLADARRQRDDAIWRLGEAVQPLMSAYLKYAASCRNAMNDVAAADERINELEEAIKTVEEEARASAAAAEAAEAERVVQAAETAEAVRVEQAAEAAEAERVEQAAETAEAVRVEQATETAEAERVEQAAEPAQHAQLAQVASLAAEPSEGLTCPTCGSVVSPTDKFCMGCGKPLAGILATQKPGFMSDPESTSAPEAETHVAVGQVVEPEPKPTPGSEPVPSFADEPEPTPEQPTARASFCPSCGTQVGPTDRFCLSCGARLVSA